jgi:hypothetical protein
MQDGSSRTPDEEAGLRDSVHQSRIFSRIWPISRSRISVQRSVSGGRRETDREKRMRGSVEIEK